MATVTRIRHTVGSHGGLTTLEQRFRFEGQGATAARIADVLQTAPLVGDASIFGDRPGKDDGATGPQRRLRGFSPAPGFRFDVDLVELAQGVLQARFSQENRDVPYLRGDVLWTVSDDDGGAVLDEQINTAAALEKVGEPITGPRPSLRRWLFFRVGHAQVMKGATANIARLVETAD